MEKLKLLSQVLQEEAEKHTMILVRIALVLTILAAGVSVLTNIVEVLQ
jgi:hypothetical protein